MLNISIVGAFVLMVVFVFVFSCLMFFFSGWDDRVAVFVSWSFTSSTLEEKRMMTVTLSINTKQNCLNKFNEMSEVLLPIFLKRISNLNYAFAVRHTFSLLTFDL